MNSIQDTIDEIIRAMEEANSMTKVDESMNAQPTAANAVQEQAENTAKAAGEAIPKLP